MRLLEVDFAGNNAKEDREKSPATRKGLTKAKIKILKDIEAAGAFLEEHETAKIIVTIDTHCLEENGLLVYSDEHTLDACSLLTVGLLWAWFQYGYPNVHHTSQILRDCIPDVVLQYLTNDTAAPVHAHKSIIFNLACGATIRGAESRSAIFEGYVCSHPHSQYAHT